MIKKQISEITSEAHNRDIPETKADKFIRLAEYRTRKVIHYLDALGYLANKAAYEQTPEQVNLIFTAILNKVYQNKDRLLGKEIKPPLFSLKVGE